jgi:hypothetical protein
VPLSVLYAVALSMPWTTLIAVLIVPALIGSLLLFEIQKPACLSVRTPVGLA